MVYIINYWDASLTSESLWLFQIRCLHLLLTVRESAIEVPTSLEARRRIAFFTNSLFMDMSRAPWVRKMLSFRCDAYFLCLCSRTHGLEEICHVCCILNLSCALCIAFCFLVCSVLTPYYSEETVYSKNDLEVCQSYITCKRYSLVCNS